MLKYYKMILGIRDKYPQWFQEKNKYFFAQPTSAHWINSCNTVLQKKRWSVAEARPANSGSYRLTKQESAGADVLDQFVCARYSSLNSGIPALLLLFSHSLKNQ